MAYTTGVYVTNAFLQNTLFTIRRGVELGGFPPELYDIMSKPQRILVVNIPVKTDGGKIQFFEGYRVQHSDVLGPFKGGIRFHPEVTLSDDVALATLMTLKNSLAGIPYGGAKGAVRVDPKKLSMRELEQLSRGYVRAIAPLIGDLVDIPAPDVGTNSQIMAWMVDEYSKIKGYNVPGVFTAKPPELWGNPVREYATGLGVAIAAREIAKTLWNTIEGKTVAVQGMGNVGRWSAYWAAKMGARVVAVSDINGVAYKKEGLNVDLIYDNRSQSGTSLIELFIAKDGASHIKNPDALLSLEVDILIPAAIENVIREDNVGLVKARLIVEGANGPTTPGAERILYERGVVVVPDILANAGGVVMSYLEWVENLQWYIWDEEETRKKLEQIMSRNVKNVYEKATREKWTMRDAAIVTALDRIYKAMKVRGWL